MRPLCRKTCWPLRDVLAGVEHAPVRVDDALRDRRLGHVGAVGEQAEDEEAEQDDQQHRLDPALRDQQLPPLGLLHRRSSPPHPNERTDALNRLRRGCLPEPEIVFPDDREKAMVDEPGEARSRVLHAVSSGPLPDGSPPHTRRRHPRPARASAALPRAGGTPATRHDTGTRPPRRPASEHRADPAPTHDRRRAPRAPQRPAAPRPPTRPMGDRPRRQARAGGGGPRHRGPADWLLGVVESCGLVGCSV